MRAASSGFGTKTEKDFKQLRLTMLTYALYRAAHMFDHDHFDARDDDDYLLSLTPYNIKKTR